MNQPFKFKQFTIQQDQCAMKIGTDAVLLGSWVEVPARLNSILDIGAGTGIISLMLAQRSLAEIIDAVELEPNAHGQCVDNFENSIWSDRLFCYHADFKDFALEIEDSYDLIICNPPYFETPKSNTNSSIERKTARFKATLSYQELLEGVRKLLSHSGQFALIIPFQDEEEFLIEAAQEGLYCQRKTHVRGHADASIKRSLMQFGLQQTKPNENELIIEISRHQYTSEYINLTKDFYLDM